MGIYFGIDYENTYFCQLRQRRELMFKEAKSFQTLVCKLFVSPKLGKEHDLKGNEKARQELL